MALPAAASPKQQPAPAPLEPSSLSNKTGPSPTAAIKTTETAENSSVEPEPEPVAEPEPESQQQRDPNSSTTVESDQQTSIESGEAPQSSANAVPSLKPANVGIQSGDSAELSQAGTSSASHSVSPNPTEAPPAKGPDSIPVVNPPNAPTAQLSSPEKTQRRQKLKPQPLDLTDAIALPGSVQSRAEVVVGIASHCLNSALPDGVIPAIVERARIIETEQRQLIAQRSGISPADHSSVFAPMATFPPRPAFWTPTASSTFQNNSPASIVHAASVSAPALNVSPQLVVRDDKTAGTLPQMISMQQGHPVPSPDTGTTSSSATDTPTSSDGSSKYPLNSLDEQAGTPAAPNSAGSGVSSRRARVLPLSLDMEAIRATQVGIGVGALTAPPMSRLLGKRRTREEEAFERGRITQLNGAPLAKSGKFKLNGYYHGFYGLERYATGDERMPEQGEPQPQAFPPMSAGQFPVPPQNYTPSLLSQVPPPITALPQAQTQPQLHSQPQPQSLLQVQSQSQPLIPPAVQPLNGSLAGPPLTSLLPVQNYQSQPPIIGPIPIPDTHQASSAENSSSAPELNEAKRARYLALCAEAWDLLHS